MKQQDRLSFSDYAKFLEGNKIKFQFSYLSKVHKGVAYDAVRPMNRNMRVRFFNHSTGEQIQIPK